MQPGVVGSALDLCTSTDVYKYILIELQCFIAREKTYTLSDILYVVLLYDYCYGCVVGSMIFLYGGPGRCGLVYSKRYAYGKATRK